MYTTNWLYFTLQMALKQESKSSAVGVQRIKSGSTKLGGIREGFVMQVIFKLDLPWEMGRIIRWRIREE